jgi:cell division septum initiation protein DivIVA
MLDVDKAIENIDAEIKKLEAENKALESQVTPKPMSVESDFTDFQVV